MFDDVGMSGWRFLFCSFLWKQQPTTSIAFAVPFEWKRSGFSALFRHVEVNFLWERKEIFFLTRVFYNGGIII